jgi:hypothetical protein
LVVHPAILWAHKRWRCAGEADIIMHLTPEQQADEQALRDKETGAELEAVNKVRPQLCTPGFAQLPIPGTTAGALISEHWPEHWFRRTGSSDALARPWRRLLWGVTLPHGF